jgi:hypothetical protein
MSSVVVPAGAAIVPERVDPKANNPAHKKASTAITCVVVIAAGIALAMCFVLVSSSSNSDLGLGIMIGEMFR